MSSQHVGEESVEGIGEEREEGASNSDSSNCAESTDSTQVMRELEEAERELRHARKELEHAEHDVEQAEEALTAVIRHDHEIHFRLDGEDEKTDCRELTPNQIIFDFGKKDASTHYLVRIENGHKVEDYKGKGDDKIKLHDGMCFQIISTGPTPVSDGRPKTGVEAFVDGIRELGYVPTALNGKPDHVAFDYCVQSGKYTGKNVRLGFIVPADFPQIVPTGPHVSPNLHPINTVNGPHPTFGIHASPFVEAGGEWQYWSRPCSEWASSKKTVASYMSHIWQLWDSQ